MFSFNTDLSNKYTEHWFEQIINGLTIKEGKEKYLRNQVNYVKNKLIEVSEWTFNPPQNAIQEFSNAVQVKGFWYGGSFDLGVHINKKFDIDTYMIYKENDGFFLNLENLDGEYMFTTLNDDLDSIHEKINKNLVILEPLPRTHAIPIELHYQNKVLKMDCIPAIELPNNLLLVPDGWNDQKKINLKSEEGGLNKLNKKHHGNGTKLILLLKYWNWRWKKPLKSYVIQRLVEEIFMDHEINGWKGAVRTFFRESVILFGKHFNNELILKDRVYTNRSILNDYDVKQLNNFNNKLRHANNLVNKNQWEKLFGK